MKPRRPATSSAFTLVEILVAVTILSVLVALLASIMGSVQQMWLQIDAQNQRQANGRLLISFIANELQTAAIPRLPAPAALINSGTAPIDTPGLQFVVNVSGDDSNSRVTIDRQFLRPHAIFWQAPAAATKTLGNVTELGYFVRWDTDTKPGRLLAQLCRFQIDPADSPAATETDTNYLIYETSGTRGEKWLTAELINEVAPGSADLDKNYKGVFADNVLALWIRCLDTDGEPITRDIAGRATGYAFDSNWGFIDSRDRRHPAPCLPPMVEIAIVTVDSRTALRLTDSDRADMQSYLDAADNPRFFWRDLNNFVEHLPPHLKSGARVFSTVTKLPNAN
ncbi:MAG: type II secretion system GspH family protein [Verrucomicrobiales bacterium]|jgi:uncharacterized protein (TIGR02599 family)|nr:type II secretion system GspH family protein [Verrucomicrobiales bacterium]